MPTRPAPIPTWCVSAGGVQAGPGAREGGARQDEAVNQQRAVNQAEGAGAAAGQEPGVRAEARIRQGRATQPGTDGRFIIVVCQNIFFI